MTTIWTTWNLQNSLKFYKHFFSWIDWEVWHNDETYRYVWNSNFLRNFHRTIWEFAQGVSSPWDSVILNKLVLQWNCKIHKFNRIKASTELDAFRFQTYCYFGTPFKLTNQCLKISWLLLLHAIIYQNNNWLVATITVGIFP